MNDKDQDKLIGMLLFIAALLVMLFVIKSFANVEVKKSHSEVKECIGEQIQVARENWDTVKPTKIDSAEFAAQDQLRDFIFEACIEENLK